MKYQSQCPKYMRTLVFEHSFSRKPEKIEKIWQRLQLRQTFTKSQVFPFRVEFDSDTQKGPFKEGELNSHHGPLISLHGAIGKISPTYRDLQYFYGSYVLTFRWIRPTRLEFFKNNSQIKIKVTYYVRPWLKAILKALNSVFWKLFSLTLVTW